MNHRHSKTAATLPLTDGYVSRCALVVALQEVHIHSVKSKSQGEETVSAFISMGSNYLCYCTERVIFEGTKLKKCKFKQCKQGCELRFSRILIPATKHEALKDILLVVIFLQMTSWCSIHRLMNGLD